VAPTLDLVAPFLKYTVLRLVLFVAALAVFALLGARGILAVLLAAVASVALSFVLLRGPREELSRAIAERADPSRPRRQSRVNRRLAEDDAAEDADDERRRSEG
jgi:O-antigen ligase